MTQPPHDPNQQPGGIPSYSGGNEYAQPAAAGPRPKSLDLAVKGMWLGAILALLGIVALFLQDEATLRDQILDVTPNATEEDIDAGIALGRIFGVVVGIISAAIWALMAVFNGKGKKWARIVATVLGVIALLGGIAGLFTGVGLLQVVLSVVQIILVAGILFFLYKPDSSAYYNAHS